MRRLTLLLFSIFFCGLTAFLTLFFVEYTAGFSSLSAAQTFAEQMPEFPEIDNTDWHKPNYSTFFKQKNPTLFQKILYLVGVKKPYWSPKSFKELLEEVSQQRMQQGYVDKFVQKMVPQVGTKFVIWGNLQGAFHSLVRDLEELRQKGVLDNSLKIIDPAYYFVFDGNVVSRSPYSLETLTLVLQLMKVNPEQVIYIRGTHETDSYWQGFGLRTELRIRLWYLVRGDIPLSGFIDQFFNTLPFGLYLIAKETDSEIDVVRLSNEPEAKLLKEDSFAGFFPQSYRGPIFNIKDNIPPSEKKINLRAEIVSNHYKPNYYLTDGLRMLSPDNSTVVWTVLSAPTSSYKNRFNFDNDAFAILTVEQDLSQWSIGLCKQSTQEAKGFDCSGIFDLLLGFPMGKSFQYEGQFVVGSTMDLSMGLQRFNEYLEDGLQASLHDQNMQGGVDGRLVRLVIRDDAYVPARGRKNAEAFLKEGIDILLIPSGSQTLKGYLDLVEEKKMLVLFPIAGRPRELLEYIIYFRPSYFTEGKVITEHAINTAKARKFAFFYPNDDFGRSIMAGAKETLQKRGIDTYIEVEYKRNILEFKKQAEKIRDYDPDILAFFCIPVAAEELIKQIGISDLAADTLIGVSDLAINRFKQFLKSNGLHMILPAVVPNPKTSRIQLVQEYRASMKKNRVDVNTASLEGYITARVFLKAIQMARSPFSKDSIVEALENITDFSLAGFPLNFSSQDRELSYNLWIAKIPEQEDAEWEMYTLTER